MTGKLGMCFVFLLLWPLIVFADVQDSSKVREDDDSRRKYIVEMQDMFEGQSIRFRTSSMFKKRKSGLFEEITATGIRASMVVNRFQGKRESILIPYSELESLEIYVGPTEAKILGGFFKGALIGATSGFLIGWVLVNLEKCEPDDSLCGLGAASVPFAMGLGGFIAGGSVGAIFRFIAADRDGWRVVPVKSIDINSMNYRYLSVVFAWKF